MSPIVIGKDNQDIELWIVLQRVCVKYSAVYLQVIVYEGCGKWANYLNKLWDFLLLAFFSQRSLELLGSINSRVAAQIFNLGFTKDNVCVRSRALVYVWFGDNKQDLREISKNKE